MRASAARLFALASLLAATLAPAAAQTPTAQTPPAQSPSSDPVQAMLDRRAAAVLAGDSAAFDATMAGASAAFAGRQRAAFRRIRTLPLGEYRLEIEPDEFGDLARQKDRVAGADETRVLQVKERIGLRGYDARPSNEDVFLTVVRRAGTWTVHDDTAVEDLGLRSMRHLWDFGDVETRVSGGIMVVFHASERSVAPAVLDMATRARAKARKGWPLSWQDPIVVMIPSTLAELERILQTTFDLSSFVAFAASSLDRADGYRLTGNRVFLHWPNLKRYSASFQEQVLAHEFTHLATRDIAGPYITAIFDEGIAQVYGEDGGETTQLSRRVKNRTLPAGLVPDWYFTAGPRDDIFLAYEEAASFVAFLNQRYGRDAGARAYKALGTIDAISTGTWRYHLDRVTVSLFEQPYRALEAAWHASVTKRFG